MASLLESVYDLPDVSFIDNDTIEAMAQRMINSYESFYEEENGQKISLASGDPMRIAIMACAYELFHIKECVDRAGKMDLLKYSYGDFLDNIAASKTVTRQQAAAATTTIRFTFSAAQSYVLTIPEGTRVTNGQGVYFTTDYAEAEAGASYVDVTATCTETGVKGNGFVPGQIDVLVDPLPYVDSIANITTSAGGSSVETDENFRERVYLYPSSYSVAGPAGAYVYWAKTYSSAVGAVKAVSVEPGQVIVYLLMADGSLPEQEVLTGLQEYLSTEQVRPMTDTVTVSAPAVSGFALNMTYYINTSEKAKAITVQSEVAQAVSDWITWQTTEIGRDINPDNLVKRVLAAGAKRVVVSSPVFTVVPETSVAQCTSQTVSYGGLEDD